MGHARAQSLGALVDRISDEAPSDWRSQGACKGLDADLFFGPTRFEPKRERLAREATAKGVCGDCAVTEDCLEYALQHGEIYGVWGGHGENERRPLHDRYEKRR